MPHIPDFLLSFVGSLNFMRLSLKRAAHAVLSRAAYRKFGVSRSFFARCGIPRLFAPDFFAVETFSAACKAATWTVFQILGWTRAPSPVLCG